MTLVSPPRTRRLLSGDAALVAVGLAPVAVYVVIALQRIGYRYELSYFEGSTVEVTARVLAGLPLYGPPTADFTPWPYPPLYFWLGAAVSEVNGLSISSLRWVSFGASLIVLVLITMIVRRAGGSVVAGIVAAGVYASSYRVSGAWADTARVDSLLLALLLGAIFVGLRATSAHGGVAVGALLFLAFITKQNALVVAVPVLCWLLVYRRPAGIWATGSLFVAVAASTWLGDALTDGWYSSSVFGQLLGQPWAPQWLAGFWLLDIAVPFAIVIALTMWLRRRNRNEPATGPTQWRRDGATAYLLACGTGLLLAAWAGRIHDGGYANVAMPAHVAVALAFGLVVASARRRPDFSRRIAVTIAAALAVQFAVMTLWRWQVLPTDTDRNAGNSFIARVAHLPGRVLVPSHPYYLRLAGLPTHASAIAIQDAVRGDTGRVADGVRASLPWDLTGVNAVVLDNQDEARLFGDQLTRDFTLVSPAVIPDGAFVPVTDAPSRPSLLFVRTSALQVP